MNPSVMRVTNLMHFISPLGKFIEQMMISYILKSFTKCLLLYNGSRYILFLFLKQILALHTAVLKHVHGFTLKSYGH